MDLQGTPPISKLFKFLRKQKSPGLPRHFQSTFHIPIKIIHFKSYARPVNTRAPRVSLKAPPTEISDCAVLCVNSKGFALQLHFVKGAFLVAQMLKNLLAKQDTWVLSLGSGRSPAEGNGHPLQYSCLENSIDRGAWQAIVHGVTESNTTERLTHTFCPL